jgi:hypothetical protein
MFGPEFSNRWKAAAGGGISGKNEEDFTHSAQRGTLMAHRRAKKGENHNLKIQGCGTRLAKITLVGFVYLLARLAVGMA